MTRVLLRAPNWLGDAVMAIPAMAAIRAGFPEATLILAARPAIAPLFHEPTPVRPDEIIEVEPDREPAQLAASRAELAVLLPNSFGSAWTAQRAGIAERWGYAGAGRRWLLTRAVGKPRGRLHQVDYYRALAEGLGMPAVETVPRLQPAAGTIARATRLLQAQGWDPTQTLVGFAPGAAYGNAKRWPPPRVAEVMASLAGRGIVPLLVGAGADRDTGRAIESSLPAGTRLINLIGRTDLRLLVGVIARCAAFVSNDSGAMHVAAALGVPLTAIFGPTDVRATAPAGPGPREVIVRKVFCQPCMLRECPIDHRCMKRIHPADVLASLDATSSLSRS